MDEKIKQNIDDMHYESMLRLWRFAPSSHPWFLDNEIATYFSLSMQEKRDKLENAQRVSTSKNIGW